MSNFHGVLRRILQLSEKDRAAIAKRILKSLEPETDASIESAWKKEIKKRMSDIDRGRVKLISWSKVREELRRRARAAA
jgi:putative addiction module component (TIGR02574 family)